MGGAVLKILQIGVANSKKLRQHQTRYRILSLTECEIVHHI